MNDLDKELYLARNAFNEASQRLNKAIDAVAAAREKEALKRAVEVSKNMEIKTVYEGGVVLTGGHKYGSVLFEGEGGCGGNSSNVEITDRVF